MFSQACVISSVLRRGGVFQHEMGKGVYPSLQWGKGCGTHHPGQTPHGQTPTPRETATETGGTHPTGVHSCLKSYFMFFQEKEMS